MSAIDRPIIEAIVSQHVEMAAFLWFQRSLAIRDPRYDLARLTELDERVEAHIDGLRGAGEPGWALVETAIDEDDPGSIFAAAVLAFESGDGENIHKVIEVGSHSRSAFRELVSALGWLDERNFKSVIGGLVRSSSHDYRRLGMAACGIRRVDPKTYLEQATNSSDLPLRARALKAAGELKRQDLLPLVRNDLQNEDHKCRFEAARSALLLGDRSALRILAQFVQAPSEFRLPAMHVVLRLVDLATSQKWLKAMAKDKASVRDVIIGMGICGDPAYIPLLIRQMEKPELARLAGESFSMITGVDLAYDDLEGEWPEGFEAGPTDDTNDDNVHMDADEDLPWPAVGPLKHWWSQNSGAFAAGTRYLCGAPVSPEQCVQVLKSGLQRQRHAAALELALAQPGAAWFNTAAVGARQIAAFRVKP